MSYATKDIRNIALLGHGGNGKSTLAESILFLTGVTDRMGSTAAGNSVSDFDAEEIRRQISISTSTMYAEYQKTKINILDTPGYFDFAGEVVEALRVAGHRHHLRLRQGRRQRRRGEGLEGPCRTPICRRPSTSPRSTRSTRTTSRPSPPCARSSARASAPWRLP